MGVVARTLRKLAAWLFLQKGLQIVPVAKLDQTNRQIKTLSRSLDRKSKDQSLMVSLATDFNAAWVVEYLPIAKSQLRQDIFVLAVVGMRTQEGFFVEFGATDGQELSNSWLLEKEFGWSGILAEPGDVWQETLVENRSCAIDFRCVWSRSGQKIMFNETTFGELSTVDLFSESDFFARARAKGRKYVVETVSLRDLLKAHDAPKKIDYLSIDTEGSEFEILSSFEFNEYEIDVITVEHNFTSNRAKIKELLTVQGYVQLYEGLSDPDDWYVHNRVLDGKS